MSVTSIKWPLVPLRTSLCLEAGEFFSQESGDSKFLYQLVKIGAHKVIIVDVYTANRYFEIDEEITMKINDAYSTSSIGKYEVGLCFERLNARVAGDFLHFVKSTFRWKYPTPMNNPLKTSEDWDKFLHDGEKVILDPDGWDRKNWQFSWFEELISEQEFNNRLLKCTLQGFQHFRPKQVIVMRTDVKMTKGKMISQGAHASMGALLSKSTKVGDKFIIDDEQTLLWLQGAFTKVVLKCDSEEELREIYKKAYDLGIPCSMIEDNGLTQFNGVKTLTGIGLGPASNSVLKSLTGHLKLL